MMIRIGKLTMSTKSLIEKLKAASFVCDHNTEGLEVVSLYNIEEIIRDHGAEQLHKEMESEAMNDSDRPSEIRYNKLELRSRLMEIVCTYDPEQKFDRDGNLPIMNQIMGTLEPYLRTTEPVSLVHCAEAIFNTENQNPRHFWKDSHKIIYMNQAKAVLDAAGVKYE